MSYSSFQTSQTGGQWYSDTSPFSIPRLDDPFSRQIASSSGLSTVVDDSLCKAGEKPVAFKTCDDVIDGGDESAPKVDIFFLQFLTFYSEMFYHIG